MNPSSAPPDLRAALLGSPSRLPFNGFFRQRVPGVGGVLHVAGAIAVDRPPPEAWEITTRLRAVLQTVRGRNRLELVRGAWETLAALDRAGLGPRRGDDLTLLLVAVDTDGVGVAATGLAALAGVEGTRLEAVVPAEHPLLALRGIPSVPPRVLTPSRPWQVFLGAPHTGAVSLPDLPGWPRACGVMEGGAS